jgi:ABC-type sulfate/molybdate transport systems ATPase subunit
VRFGVGTDDRIAAYWLARLHLSGLERRYPDELSGGQRQRVALAQALARSPDLLFLDEPFSALDTPVRHELRTELRRLQHEEKLSTVLVTHDPEEAAYLADEVVVVRDGRILQAGPKAEVFSRPSSPEVARLVGIRNLCRGRVRRSGWVQTSNATVAMDTATLAPGAEVLWCIRPEQIVIDTDGPYRATVVDAADLGAVTELVLDVEGGLELQVRVVEHDDLGPGAPCRIALPPRAIRLWEADNPHESPATVVGSSR